MNDTIQEATETLGQARQWARIAVHAANLTDCEREQNPVHCNLSCREAADAALEAALPYLADRWWICDDALDKGGKKVLGPFATQDLAMEVRRYVEEFWHPKTFWVNEVKP